MVQAQAVVVSATNPKASSVSSEERLRGIFRPALSQSKFLRACLTGFSMEVVEFIALGKPFWLRGLYGLVQLGAA